MKRLPRGTIESVKIFDIEVGTTIVIRQTDLHSKVYQECRLTRKSTNTVEATLREFGGSRFKVAVSMAAREVTVLRPDLSWLDYADDFPMHIAAKIQKMMSAKKSTSALLLVRRAERLA